MPKTPPAPAGWQSLALTSGLPQSDCYSYGESYVAAFNQAGLVKGEGPGTTPIPTPLASRMSDDHARGVKYVFETDDGWVVMFDHGEFGGGIEGYARGGGQPRSAFVGPREEDDFGPQNVNRAVAADGVIYVLQGLAHMGISEGQLVKIWHEHDHFSSHVIARYGSEPVDWIRRDDGSWFVANWNAIWETREGVPSTVVARLPEIMSYPTALLRAADGTFFVGTRGGVVRLTPMWPEASRYAADFLWEAGSQKVNDASFLHLHDARVGSDRDFFSALARPPKRGQRQRQLASTGLFDWLRVHRLWHECSGIRLSSVRPLHVPASTLGDRAALP